MQYWETKLLCVPGVCTCRADKPRNRSREPPNQERTATIAIVILLVITIVNVNVIVNVFSIPNAIIIAIIIASANTTGNRVEWKTQKLEK